MPELLRGDDPRAVSAVARGILEGEAERELRARARPHVLARLRWWQDGAHGHYPDCPCGACAWTRHPSAEMTPPPTARYGAVGAPDHAAPGEGNPDDQ